jgi:hypothetical protein
MRKAINAALGGDLIRGFMADDKWTTLMRFGSRPRLTSAVFVLIAQCFRYASDCQTVGSKSPKSR